MQSDCPVQRAQSDEHTDDQHGHYPQEHRRNKRRACLSRPESNRRFRLLRDGRRLHEAKYSREKPQVEPKAALHTPGARITGIPELAFVTVLSQLASGSKFVTILFDSE